MKKKVLIPALSLISLVSLGQEALRSTGDLVSPLDNGDGTVTFQILAPKASRVTVTGDFLPTKKVEVGGQSYEQPGVAELSCDAHGVWRYTTGKLAPELYSYTFSVNDMQMLDPQNVYVSRDVASMSNIFIVSNSEGDRGSLYRVNEVAHGNVERVWYDSPTLKTHRRMTIYTPPGYDKGSKYPVLYLLHGAGGDEEAWTTLGRAAQIMDNLISSGRCKPMIVVMPNGNPACQAAPGEWSRGMYKPSFMESLTPHTAPVASMEESFPDIIKYVESHYKVQKSKRSRAICGLSMGGGHSFAISKRYPEMFGYVGLFSAGLNIGQRSNEPFYSQLQTDSNVQQQLSRLFSGKPQLYFIAIGKTDFLYNQNADLRRYLDDKGYKYEYMETEGGHIWRNWRIYLTTFAEKIF